MPSGPRTPARAVRAVVDAINEQMPSYWRMSPQERERRARLMVADALAVRQTIPDSLPTSGYDDGRCPECEGSGFTGDIQSYGDDRLKVCEACGGSGKATEENGDFRAFSDAEYQNGAWWGPRL